MNFKKTFITLTASLTLASVCPAIINSQKVEAQTHYSDKEFLKYAKKFHKVVIIDRTQVYKVHRGYDEVHNRYTKAYVLNPGDVATIRDRGIAWGWTIGKKYNYCSMRDPYNFKWFDTYSKHKYIDVSAFKHVKHGTQYYQFTWPQYVRLCKMNFWESTSSERKAINRYIKSINPKIIRNDQDSTSQTKSQKNINQTSNNTNSTTSSSNQSSNNTTSSSNQTSSSSQFTGFPAGAGLMEKAKILFSLSGDARKQADLALMKELGEVDPQGHPEVPISSFESHLKEIYDSAQSLSESIERGGQAPLEFR